MYQLGLSFQAALVIDVVNIPTLNRRRCNAISDLLTVCKVRTRLYFGRVLIGLFPNNQQEINWLGRRAL
jgi:hypothetical protein